MVTGPLSSDDLALMDAWWRAANYLSVGQIYLLDNPLLREPLELKHIKPRLLGHWGTTPGQNFLYAHLNRVIKSRNLDMIYVAGPGHGGHGVVANVSWHSNKFLNPATDGAVLPILHLNGYKIANPAVLARIGPEELDSLFVGYGYKPHLIEGDDPPVMHQLAAGTFDRVFDEILARYRPRRDKAE